MFEWIVSHPYVYPALEVLHIVGIALLLGNLVLFELRVWGFGPELPLAALARLALRLSLAGFGLIAASGLLMFAGQPAELLANRSFVVKIGLVLLAGLNAAWFHARGSLQRLDRSARVQTVVSMGLWLAVIICGRWIAYQ
ncbi:MAG: hypothetical protein ACRC2B_12130 [Rubrivivax sp.]